MCMRTKLLILCLLTVSFAKSQNLLQNGSFENFTGTLPNSWTILNGSSNKETATFNHGQSSLKGFPETAMSSSPYFWISQDFTLSDREVYTLKFDYYVPGTILTNNISRVGYELSLNDDSAFFFPSPSQISLVFGSWQTVTFDFNILAFKNGATSSSIKLTLQANSDMGFTDTNVIFDNVSIAKKGTLGTVDFDKKTNPIASMSKDEIKLSNDFKNSSYVIYSIDGKAVKRVNNNSSETIAIAGLPNGVYLLKLNDLGTSVKFIK